MWCYFGLLPIDSSLFLSLPFFFFLLLSESERKNDERKRVNVIQMIERETKDAEEDDGREEIGMMRMRKKESDEKLNQRKEIFLIGKNSPLVLLSFFSLLLFSSFSLLFLLPFFFFLTE